MDECFISFVIPVYNVEDYVGTCIDSVLSVISIIDYQSEILIVDDGSTDNSGNICDEYSSRYPDTVRVVHQVNGGLSNARNTGTKLASGKWILYIDSDDWIVETNAIDIFKAIENSDADCILLGVKQVFSNGGTRSLFRGLPARMDSAEALKWMGSSGVFPCSGWGKALRRDFIIKNDLMFKDGLISEDMDWMLRLLKDRAVLESLDLDYYMYRTSRPGSISKTTSRTMIESLCWIIENHATRNATSGTEYWVNAILAYVYGILLVKTSTCTEIDSQLFERISSNRWIIAYSKSGKTRIITAIVRVFGIKAAINILGKSDNLKNNFRFMISYALHKANL